MPGMTNHLLKINKELNNLKKQEAEDTFIKVNQIKPDSNMIWFMKIIKICPKEQHLIKYYVIKQYCGKSKNDGYQRGIDLMMYKC